ncbi:MAG TPA: nitronate monooxygenase [Pseudonocardiaceae bacterium]|jgi:nitronate monooxygenase|nr:nitronate monooxygenase [Pseudonocardiaceae bacterium]
MLSTLRIPVVAAPMAGGPTTPALTAAVSGAGGFGFLAAGYRTPDQVAEQIAQVRSLTAEPFGVNVFVPGEEATVDLTPYRELIAAHGTEPGEPTFDDDAYPAKIDLLVAERVPVVSFTFGLPTPDDVARLHGVGTEIAVTVTTPHEARSAAERGVDALVVQGFEAGGHRSVFTDDPASPAGGDTYGLLALLRVVGAAVDLPLVAAGGIVHGGDVAAVLAGGAVAAQLGTAFLRSPEAGTPAAQRTALAETDRSTSVTRAFSGRPARGIVNRFMIEHDAQAPAAYPQVNNMTRPIRSAAAAAGDYESMSLWAGQTYPLATAEPAADVVRRLHDEAVAALAAARARFSG